MMKYLIIVFLLIGYTCNATIYSIGFGINILNMEIYHKVINANPIEIPYNTNEFNIEATIINHMNNFTEKFPIHIDEKTSISGVSSLLGSFSIEYDNIHKIISNKYIQIAYLNTKITTSKLTTDSLDYTLDKNLEKLIYKIGYSKSKNTSLGNKVSRYYSNELIKNYGTHYISQGILGGRLSQIISINVNDIKSYDINTFKTEASIEYGIFFGIQYIENHTRNSDYVHIMTKNKLKIEGGIPFTPNNTWTLKTWSESVEKTPFMVDIYINPITNLVLYNKLPTNLVSIVHREISDAINKHIDDNTYTGCMDPHSKEYNFRANMQTDDSCHVNLRYGYGGIYQTSSLEIHIVKNLITLDTTCPYEYATFPLTPIQHIHYNIPGTYETCIEDCIVHTILCRILCYGYYPTHTDTYTIQTFVCLTNITNPSYGLYFGGAFTIDSPNPITGSKSCPDKFLEQKITETMSICELTMDILEKYPIHMGGMFTSQKINPFTGAYYCPFGYERHSLRNDDYDFFYCIGMDDMSKEKMFIVPG